MQKKMEKQRLTSFHLQQMCFDGILVHFYCCDKKKKHPDHTQVKEERVWLLIIPDYNPLVQAVTAGLKHQIFGQEQREQTHGPCFYFGSDCVLHSYTVQGAA